MVSFEQAFNLLLNKNKSTEAYFVYDELMRAGYIVELCNNGIADEQLKCKAELSPDKACIWQCFMENLRTTDKRCDDELHLKTRKSMQ